MLIQSSIVQIIFSILGLGVLFYFRFFKKGLYVETSRRVIAIFSLDLLGLSILFLSILGITIKMDILQDPVILIDGSYSMSVNDYKPNRYEWIKTQLIDYFSVKTQKPDIVIFASYPIPLSYSEYVQSDYNKFGLLQGRSGSAPGDVLLRAHNYYKKRDLILITDGGINTGYDLGDTLNTLSGNIIIGILDTKDQIIQLSGQKPALIQMNQGFWQQQTLGITDLKIISNKSDIQKLLLPKRHIIYQNITKELLTCALILLLMSILLRIFLAGRFSKDLAE